MNILDRPADRPPPLGSLPDGVAAAVYHSIAGLMLPVTAAGYALWVAKLYAKGRGSGVSLTAQAPLSSRWFQHILGTREDDASSRLMPLVPGASPLGMRLVAGPMLLGTRLTGYVPKAFRYPFEGDVPIQYEAGARQTFFDEVVDRNMDRVSQLVLLGAGFDTRSLRLPSSSRVRAFEVDRPRTQSLKKDLLARAGIDAGAVCFVPADFESEDWLAKLCDAGFDRAQPALFLWEGVIMYLDEGAVRSTLRKIATLARGTTLAFDYFTKEPLESKDLYWRYARFGTRAAGEPLKFGFDSSPPSRDRVADFLARCGLRLEEQRTLGDEAGRRRAWGGFAVAVVDRD